MKEEMAKDNDTNDTTVTADETQPLNHTSDSLPTTRKQTGPEGAVDDNDNDQNDISVTSDETNSTDQTSDSMDRTENEAGLDCAIVINDNNQNEVNVTNEITSSDQTEKETVPEGAINSYDNDQNDISLTSNEIDGTDPTSDSLPPTEKETGSESKIDNNDINANVITRMGDKGQTEVSTSEVLSSETEVPSAKSRLTRDITNSYSNDSATTIILTSEKVEETNSSDIEFVEKVYDGGKRCNDIDNKEERVPTEFICDKVQHLGETNIAERAGNHIELTIDQVKYPQEKYLLGDSHEVDNSDDEFQEEGDTHEVDDSGSESSEISSIENEDEVECDDDSNSIPDGDTTEDLYALLAMSKKRLASNKTGIKDEESEGKVEEKRERENNKNHDEHKEEMQHDDHKSEMDDEDDDSELSYSSATSRDNVSGTKPEQESAHPDQEGKKKKKDKHNAELWALLKYSQLRLSSGTIPTIAEGESEDLDVDIDEGLSYADDDLVSKSTTDSKRVLTDIEEDEDDLSLADEDTMKEWSRGIDENARSRALAALAKVSDREVKLSDKQLKQSVKLAEEAARTGVPEFRTSNNLSALDKVQLTDNFRKNRIGNVQQSRRSGEKRVRSTPLREKFTKFKMNWRKTVDDFKKTCDRAATIQNE